MTHSELVKKLFRKGQEVIPTLTPNKIDLLHAATGSAGEAGEILDEVKKHVFFNMPLDREKLKKELGDIEFYLEAFRCASGFTREEILQGNIEKLTKRYPAGYSDAAAAARVDVDKIEKLN